MLRSDLNLQPVIIIFSLSHLHSNRMTTLIIPSLAVALTLIQLSTSVPQGSSDQYNPFYNGADASTVLEAAFAQAGISLGDGLGAIGFPPPTKKPSIASRLRNLRLPSLPSFSRKRATPMPMLIPIMGTMPKPMKLDNMNSEEGQLISQLQQLQGNGAFFSNNPFIHHHVHNPSNQLNSQQIISNKQPQFLLPSSLGTTKAQETTQSFYVWPTTNAIIATTPSPLLSDQLKRLPISLTRPRSVNHNYGTSSSENWTPTNGNFGGFKPLLVSLDSSASSSSVMPTAAAPAHNLSDYYQSTKRVSFWAKRPEGSQQDITQSMLDNWKFNNPENSSSNPVDDLLKFHPIKLNGGDAGSNKIGFQINPSNLLEQINREANRRSIDCKNKDLGWCDYTDNYPT